MYRLWDQFFSFRLFYLQYPPPICGFGMRSGISHVCKVFIRNFLPEISVLPLPHPLPFPVPLPPIGFQDVTSWKNLSIMAGHYIYINHSSHANHLNLYAEQQELGKRLVPHGFHQLGVFLQWISPSYLLIQHRVWHLVFNLDFSIFSIPKAICWFGIDSGIDFWIWTFLSSVSPTYLWILHRFWDWFVNLDFSIFSIPHLFVDSAYILASRVFDTQAEIHIHVVDR